MVVVATTVRSESVFKCCVIERYGDFVVLRFCIFCWYRGCVISLLSILAQNTLESFLPLNVRYMYHAKVAVVLLGQLNLIGDITDIFFEVAFQVRDSQLLQSAHTSMCRYIYN